MGTTEHQDGRNTLGRLNTLGNQFAIGLWASMAVWVGLTERWTEGLGVLAFGVGVTAGLAGLAWSGRLAIDAYYLPRLPSSYDFKPTLKHQVARLVLTLYLVAGAVLVFGVVERISFFQGGPFPRWLATRDYGNTWPPGEVERLRTTECKDLGPLEIVQNAKGYAVRCGDFIWRSHTYTTTVNPILADDPSGATEKAYQQALHDATTSKQQSTDARAAISASNKALDFNYTIDGDYSWTPIQVYSDGAKTYLRMPANISAETAPTLFIENADKVNNVVSYRITGICGKDQAGCTSNPVYVVDRTFDVAALKVGPNETVIITHQAQGHTAGEKQ